MNYLFSKNKQISDDIIIIDSNIKNIVEEIVKDSEEIVKDSDEIVKDSDEIVKDSDEIVKDSDEIVKDEKKIELPPIPIRVRKPIRKYTTFSVSLFSHKIVEIYSNKSVNLGICVGIGIGFSLGSILSLFLISQINKNQIN